MGLLSRQTNYDNSLARGFTSERLLLFDLADEERWES